MNSILELLERSLRRDAAMRSSGRSPTPLAESRLIEFIVEHDLFGGAHVRDWLRARSDSQNYWVIKGVLACVWPLIKSGFTDDAVSIFSRVVGAQETSESKTRRSQVLSAQSGLRYHVAEILKRDDVPSSALQSWGIALTQLLGLLLKDEHEQYARRHFAGAEVESAADRESLDNFHYSYYSPHRHDSSAWNIVARAVERVFTQSCNLSKDNVFRQLATLAIEAGWGLSLCQPLVALLDYLRSGLPVTWQRDAALWLVSLPEIEGKYATMSWRRLLRKALLPQIGDIQRLILVETVRQYQNQKRCRLNELSDFAGYVALTASEEAELVQSRLERALYDTSDSREAPRIVSAGFRDKEGNEPRLWESWPHIDDRDGLRELIQSEKRSGAHIRSSTSLVVRSKDLTSLLSRPESRSPQWLTGLLRWSTAFLSDLKQSCNVDHGIPTSKELDSAHYLSALTELAPWWKSLADSSLRALAESIPDESSQEREMIFWSSDDQVVCSCKYLDELLAIVRGAGQIDEVRTAFEHTLVNIWPNWTAYTRFVAIANIRTFHWKTSKNLSALLEESATTSIHSHGIGLALEHILRGSAPVAQVLRVLLERLDQLTDPLEIARVVGSVIGDAVIRDSGGHEETWEVSEIAELYTQVRSGVVSGRARFTFVAAVCEGAKAHLSGLTELTDDHAHAWLEMMQWALDNWLNDSADNKNSQPFSLSAALYEIKWSRQQRASLMHGMVALILRMMREAELGGFYELHYEFRKLLKLNDSEPACDAYLLLPDDTWLRFCVASAARVSEWQQQFRTTNDIAYVSSLSGENTSDLIKSVFGLAGDKDNARRELAPVVDVLADAELHDVATGLRTWIRRA